MTAHSDDAPRSAGLKPRFWRQPRAWAARKLKLKLADAVGPLGLRVLERVDFTALRLDRDIAHVIDVGAADGTPDLYARLPTARLELFEPQPGHHDTLRTAVLAHRPGRLHPVALGAADGTAHLSLTGRSGASLVNTTHLDGTLAPTIEVPVRRLDRRLSAADLLRPCLLKIDTEGFEMEVLRGAAGLLDAIDVVVAEVHFDKPQLYRPFELVGFLAARGFQLTDMLDHHVRLGRVVCADMVFERVPR
ncbi:MAG: FkbM family methyltransferase [Hyphomicrobiaceae bacterium]|nr:FkbM family methyltransferase [Hyphomicrobiaceae bacterium]